MLKPEDLFLIMWDKVQIVDSPNLNLRIRLNDNRLIDYQKLIFDYYGEQNIPFYEPNIHHINKFTGWVKFNPELNITFNVMYIHNSNNRFTQSIYKKNEEFIVFQNYFNKENNIIMSERYDLDEDNIHDKDGSILLRSKDYFLSTRNRKFNIDFDLNINGMILQTMEGEVYISFNKSLKEPYFLEAKLEKIVKESELGKNQEEIFNFINSKNKMLNYMMGKEIDFHIITNYLENEFFYYKKKEKFNDALTHLIK
ncbi:MAG: hypothetical protein ACMXX8_03855 [Candidatus Woesearchaeota archaeon]